MVKGLKIHPLDGWRHGNSYKWWHHTWKRSQFKDKNM